MKPDFYLYQPIETRKHSLNKPDSPLEFIIKDCSEAISANPLNPKCEQ